MFIKSQTIIVFCFICMSLTCMAQVEKNADAESKKVDSIFSLFNNGFQKEAYDLVKLNLKRLKTTKSKVNLNLLLGYYFHNQLQIDSSLYYTKTALKYKEVKNDSLNNRLTLLAYNLFALNYKVRGLKQESKKWHLLGVELSEKTNEKTLFYTHLHGLANSYMALGEEQKALKLFKQCLEDANDEEIILGSCINLGAIYTTLGKYKTSNIYLQRAKRMCLKSNTAGTALVNILINLGDNFLHQGEKGKALDTYLEVRSKSREKAFYNLELLALEKIGSILFSAKKYDDATLIFTEVLMKATDLGILRAEMYSYEMLSTIYEEKGNYKQAYITQKNYQFIKDSISNLEKSEEINRLEVKFQTSEKEKAIKILQVESLNKSLKIKTNDAAIDEYKLEQNIIAKQSENKVLQLQNGAVKRKNEIILLKEQEELKELELDRQKTIQYIVLVAFIILLVPSFGLLIIYYQKLQAQSLLLMKEKEIGNQKVNALVKDQELKLIKAAIKGQDKERKKIAQDMHDSIGGNLAAIKLQFSQLPNNPQLVNLIYEQLDDTYEQVRNISHNLLPKKVRETDLTILIREYIINVIEPCDIEVHTVFYSEEKLNELDKEIQNEFFAIFQELSNNTIKHAKASTVDLQIDFLNESIFFVFEDNGIGFNISNTSTGIGLTNIKSRVINLKGVLNIDSHPNRGTIINIEIPVKNKLNEA